MKILCRLGWHNWRIWAVDMAGHQSKRWRRCMRGDCPAEQVQSLGYFGGAVGPWKKEAR